MTAEVDETEAKTRPQPSGTPIFGKGQRRPGSGNGLGVVVRNELGVVHVPIAGNGSSRSRSRRSRTLTVDIIQYSSCDRDEILTIFSSHQ